MNGRGPASKTSYLRLALSIAAARPRFAVGYAIIAIVVLLAVFAPWLAPYDPVEADPVNFLQPPGPAHWFGTDAVGMDILSRTLYAPRIDLTIAVIGTVISALIGSIIGAWVGLFSRGRGVRAATSYFVMRVADVLQAFPVFVLAIGLVSTLGQSIQTVVAAIAFVNIPIYLRLMRSQVMSLREMRFVEAAIVARLPTWKLMTRHMIPNAMGSALAQLSVNIGWSILLTAGLSFVGAGVRPPAPEWGSMIAGGFQNVVTGQWWPSVVPGLALGTTVFAFSLIGSSLETFFDPIKMRRLAREIAARRPAGATGPTP